MGLGGGALSPLRRIGMLYEEKIQSSLGIVVLADVEVVNSNLGKPRMLIYNDQYIVSGW